MAPGKTPKQHVAAFKAGTGKYAVKGGKRDVPFDWEFLGAGAFRRVFFHKGYVIKVPVDWRPQTGKTTAESFRHDRSNQQEAQLYRAQRRGEIPGNHLAPCRLLKNGWLVMKYTRSLHAPEGHHSPVFDEKYGISNKLGFLEKLHDNLPGWTKYTGDCCQAGYTAEGKVRLYDFGNESHRDVASAWRRGQEEDEYQRRQAAKGLGIAVEAWAKAMMAAATVMVPDPPKSGVRVRTRDARVRFTSPLTLRAA